MCAAIAAAGRCQWTPEELSLAGYASVSHERADHSSFLIYLNTNPTGVRMLGTLVDASLIMQLLGQASTGMIALLTYLVATLDFNAESLRQDFLESMASVSNHTSS
eukprot:TRINITY_DN67782_c0_g1_i1.p2 TRINITY_DN67782_c0_g1~~TRINITY_DN67782_c0_g1_i1.p2  ORF type:complete len:106 (-),score=9.65 TRINITY_DN67782_c0_g1_i1:52-369(-)